MPTSATRRRPSRSARCGNPDEPSREVCRLSAICQQFVRERPEIWQHRAARDSTEDRQKCTLSRPNAHWPRRGESPRPGVQVPLRHELPTATAWSWGAGGRPKPGFTAARRIPRSIVLDGAVGRRSTRWVVPPTGGNDPVMGVVDVAVLRLSVSVATCWWAALSALASSPGASVALARSASQLSSMVATVEFWPGSTLRPPAAVRTASTSAI